MKTTEQKSIDRTPLIVACVWLLILAKCGFAVWAVRHWQIPIHAGWVVWPTLAFALLATGLWLTHRR